MDYGRNHAWICLQTQPRRTRDRTPRIPLERTRLAVLVGVQACITGDEFGTGTSN